MEPFLSQEEAVEFHVFALSSSQDEYRAEGFWDHLNADSSCYSRKRAAEP